MSATTPLLFTFSLFGMWFAFRISEKMHEKRLIDRKMRFKMRLIAMFLITFLVFQCAHRPFFLWILVLAVIFCLYLSQIVIRHQREKNFRSHFLEYLERVILFVRGGKSFRQALTSANQDNEAFTQQRMEKVLEFVFFSQHSNVIESDRFTQEIIKELVSIDRSSHRSLERLSLLRRNLKLESDFRRKAEQVLRRIKWQSYIFTGLYLALVLFMLTSFSIKDILNELLLSALFFGVGLVWIIFSGRTIKWNI
jgi:hypothetical protein